MSSPCGRRHSWPNHINIVFSVCLPSLSHLCFFWKQPSNPTPTMPRLALSDSVYILKFTPAQLAPSVGTVTASFDMNGGCQWIVGCPICKIPEKSSPSELTRASTLRSKLLQGNSMRHHAQLSPPVSKPTPSNIESRNGHHHRVPARPI